MSSENLNIWRRIFKSDNRVKPDSARRLVFPRTEKVVVFIVSIVIALGLWLLVNLGQQFSITINMPLSISEVDDEYALVEEPPEYIEVNISGEGWNLLNIYSNPPHLTINPDSEQIDIMELVEARMNMFQDISVQDVQPSNLEIQLEELTSRNVPVNPDVEYSFRRQCDFISEPVITPDSVTIYGAQSLVDSYSELTTERYEFTDIREDIDKELEIKKPDELLSLEQHTARLEAGVDEFTEEQVSIPVEVTGIPANRSVRFSPPDITVTFRVPLKEYEQIRESNPFEAHVDYNDIEDDTTGSVAPEITQAVEGPNLQLRNHQPRRVSYYLVVND